MSISIQALSISNQAIMSVQKTTYGIGGSSQGQVLSPGIIIYRYSDGETSETSLQIRQRIFESTSGWSGFVFDVRVMVGDNTFTEDCKQVLDLQEAA